MTASSCHCIEENLEKGFEKVGECVSRFPWHSIIISIVITSAMGAGYIMLEDENRPEKQWVPLGSPALDQNEIIKSQWPSTRRFNFYIATCKDKPQDQCNMFETKYIQHLHAMQNEITKIIIDGDSIVKELDDLNPSAVERPWEKYAGNWAFDKNKIRRFDESNSGMFNEKCFRFGPTSCAEQSIMEVFGGDPVIIDSLDDQSALLALNSWEKQETPCPLTLTRTDSPCVNTSVWAKQAKPDDCAHYKSKTQRTNCRESTEAYCKHYCPAAYGLPPGGCSDEGCVEILGFTSQLTERNDNDTIPDNGFQIETFKISAVASSGTSGPEKTNEKFKGAKAFFGFYALKSDTILQGGTEVDLIANEWEKEALCVLGIKADADDSRDCKGDDLVHVDAQFSRSLGDEFGAAVRGDVGALGGAYMIILVYAAIFLSRCDGCVNTMIGMSFVVLLVVGFSFLGAMGTGAYFGVPNNALNQNIPFLLLGLGVDDAFVLAGEYALATRKMGVDSPIEDRIVETIKAGGISILITSVTDALAFGVGSFTVLPALSWFCRFACLGIIYCFLLQIFFFLPALLINARRAKANYLDVFCCFQQSECCSKKESSDDSGTEKDCMPFTLRGCLKGFAEKITTLPGKIVTILIFAIILALGIVGCLSIYKDFNIEWFFPDDSYVNNFLRLNGEYFASGTPFTVYTQEFDYFKKQSEMEKLGDYLKSTKYVELDGINDWFTAFKESSIASESEFFSPNGFTDESGFYMTLRKWHSSGGGIRYRNNIQWKDSNCDNATNTNCDSERGIEATRLSATIKLEYTGTGVSRYTTMETLRNDITNILPDAFPFSVQFLYWEEVGIIDAELLRNLIVCGVVVILVVMFLIPVPRIAIFVILCIVLSIVNVLGFMYWWDVTISGVSTIYVLISVGLAVDYSAHIAHMFVVSSGTSNERAVEAVKRIGPSVFHALMSTFLAVVLISGSKSFVFRIFFRVMFLVVIFGGSHGLWLLPVLLSIFGGEKESKELVPSEESPQKKESGIDMDEKNEKNTSNSLKKL